jgi:methionyl-tRNA synthetase
MKKYLLFSFGQFNDKSVKTILNLISRFSDDDKLLFQNGSEYLNVQFSSKYSLDYLRYMISKDINDMTNCNFLFEDYVKDVRSILKIDSNQSLNDYIMIEAAKIKYQSENEEALSKLDKICEQFRIDNDLPNWEKKEEDFTFIQKLDLVIKDFIDDNKTDVNNVEDFECVDNDDDIYITKTLKKEYNIDDILDKINEKGLSSLDKEELNFLNNLSK